MTSRIRSFVDELEEKIPQIRNRNIDVILTDDVHISRLHGTFLGVKKLTDVIAFNLGEGSNDCSLPTELEDEDVWGEVYVNLEQAVRQASERGEGITNETAELIAHGLLHLAGWDDDTAEKRDQMLEEGHRLVKEFEQEHGEFGS